MAPPIFTLLEGRIRLLRHDHVAILSRGSSEAFRFVSFLAEGLEKGDLCLCLASTDFAAELLGRLQGQVRELEQSLHARRLRLHSGSRDLSSLRDFASEVFVDAEENRTPGVRWFEEAGWQKITDFPKTQFFEFHAIVNYQVKHYSSVALCQFDLDETEPDDLLSVISVHRHLLFDNTLIRDNPFYIPPEKFLSMAPEQRSRDLFDLFREMGFDVARLLAAIAGYGRIEPGRSEDV